MGIRIDRVYTRSGDSGQTGLVGGKRVAKCHPRVCSYGDVDELNSYLGVVKEQLTEDTSELKLVIEYLQQELFDLGSELATPPEAEYQGMWRADITHIEILEKLCDKYSEKLNPLSSFILPGGSSLAANLHVARCVARRAERELVRLIESGEEQINTFCLQYLNRLSDFLFILSRWSLLRENKEAPLWQKARERVIML